MGFMKGIDGVHEAGKNKALARLASAPEFAGWVPGKILAAGYWVTASVRKGDERGVAVFRFDEATKEIVETKLHLGSNSRV
jgi:hypothetical protein